MNVSVRHIGFGSEKLFFMNKSNYKKMITVLIDNINLIILRE